MLLASLILGDRHDFAHFFLSNYVSHDGVDGGVYGGRPIMRDLVRRDHMYDIKATENMKY